MTVDGFQLDYVKFELHMEQDRFAQEFETFKETMRHYPGLDTSKPPWKVTTMGGWGSVAKYYIIEAWGPVCELANNLINPAWFGRLTRVDYKAILWDKGIDENYMVGMTLGMADTLPMVSTFNKPGRSKAGDQDGGGKGWAMGSHKSDLRVSSYSKNRREPGIEFQCRDKMLKRLRNAVVRAMPERSSNRVLFTSLGQEICKIAYKRVKKKFTEAGLVHTFQDYALADVETAILSQESALALADLEAAEQVEAERIRQSSLGLTE